MTKNKSYKPDLINKTNFLNQKKWKILESVSHLNSSSFDCGNSIPINCTGFRFTVEKFESRNVADSADHVEPNICWSSMTWNIPIYKGNKPWHFI